MLISLLHQLLLDEEIISEPLPIDVDDYDSRYGTYRGTLDVRDLRMRYGMQDVLAGVSFSARTE